MNLRIIAGTHKRRYISLPNPGNSFRPTLERCREALLESIKGRINAAHAADICAGSGAVGIELLSRGAADCVFVESNRRRLQLLSKTILTFGLASRSSLIGQPAHRFLRSCRQKFDIIFYDPPYQDTALQDIAPNLLAALHSDGLLLYEHTCSAERINALFSTKGSIIRSMQFGDTTVDHIVADPKEPERIFSRNMEK